MAGLVLVNPRARKHKRKAAKRVVHRRKRIGTSVKSIVRRRKYRSNPISTGGIAGQLKGAGIGALGALAVDVAMSRLPIPVQFKSGQMRYLAQGLVSLGLGMVIAKVGRNKSLGVQVSSGGLTIAMHAMMKNAVGPNLGLSDDLLGYDLLGYDQMNGYDEMNGVDDYDDMAGTDDDDENGWISPAPLSSY